MGGPAVARGRGRPRKEAAKVAEPPLTAAEPATPSKQPSNSAMEDGGMNPNLPSEIILGISSAIAESGQSRLSWASVVLGIPSRHQKMAEEVADVCHMRQQPSIVTNESMTPSRHRQMAEEVADVCHMRQEPSIVTDESTQTRQPLIQSTNSLRQLPCSI
ncbi:unnamed protein product [Amaranthus hypochondriacus]